MEHLENGLRGRGEWEENEGRGRERHSTNGSLNNGEDGAIMRTPAFMEKK